MKKYKVWDIKNDCFLKCETFLTQSGDLFQVNKEGHFQRLETSDYYIKFSVGLKDKNGIEAYFGDVVRLPEFNVVLRYGKHDSLFSGSGDFGCYVEDINKPGETSPMWDLSEGEILGDIFELASQRRK